MANRSKHQKSSTEENNIDRISSLTDDLLCSILSFHSTKAVVATSILSKRWKLLWTRVPNINLNGDKVVRRGSHMSFGEIVDKVVSSRDKDFRIKRFRLRCHESDWDSIYTDKWISVAKEQKLEELEFVLNSESSWHLETPSVLFDCTTLRVLKLFGYDIIINVPSSFNLPSLKVMHLRDVFYKDDWSIRNLLAGCPVLEELLVERAYEDNILDYEISSPPLRNLTVIYSEVEEYLYDVDDKLARRNKVHLKNLCCLVEAKISVYPNGNLSPKDYEDSVGVLQAVHNVKYLALSEDTMWALHYDDSPNFPVFHNLVRLKLDGFCCFWSLLLKLLLKSPLLEHLILSQPSNNHSSECWMQPPYVPMCFSAHLTTFYYEAAFKGSEDDIEFVGYVLENSLVLESMTIRCLDQVNLNHKFVVRQKIEKYRKSSEKCRLKFD